jgi:hypothetical protein
MVVSSGEGKDAERWVVLGDDLATFGTHDAGPSELLRWRVAALGVDVTPRTPERIAP